MMFGFGRGGSPSRPVYGLHPHSPRAARRSAPTNNLPVIYVSLNTHILAGFHGSTFITAESHDAPGAASCASENESNRLRAHPPRRPQVSRSAPIEYAP